MTAAPALHTHGIVQGVQGTELFKVVAPDEMVAWNPEHCLLLGQNPTGRFAGTISTAGPRDGRVQVSELRNNSSIAPGDVVRLREGSSQISVVYRRGSKANALFVTERCNSLCLMCSQPPREIDDRWRIPELLRTVSLIDPDEAQLTITGGEPTLAGSGLIKVLQACQQHLPQTHIHVLTNGRTFSDSELAADCVAAGGPNTTWAVPVYADNALVHDQVMASEGAFAETMAGLYQLARLQARVELRVVLHALTTPRLPQLAGFFYRRLPFVEHIALMGLEPIGFARQNRAALWIDPADYIYELQAATHYLANRGLKVSIYNLPLCVLPKDLWPFARQSISDWKNKLAPECEPCSMRDRCAGFFASAGSGWRSRAVAPIKTWEEQYEMA